MYFSPGPWPGSSGTTEASRNASCSDFSPSRSGAAWYEPISVALAVTSPASAWMSLRASSRSLCASPSSASPRLTAAELIRCTATVVITSTAGTSAMSRVMASKSGVAAFGASGCCGVWSLMSRASSC